MFTAEGPRALPRRRRSRHLPALVAALAFAAGQVSLPLTAARAAAQSPTVSIVDFGFAPMVGPEPGFLQRHAHVGFANNGGVQHNVTFDDGRIPSSPMLNRKQFFDAVITIAGTFSYHCTIRPAMRGQHHRGAPSDHNHDNQHGAARHGCAGHNTAGHCCTDDHDRSAPTNRRRRHDPAASERDHYHHHGVAAYNPSAFLGGSDRDHHRPDYRAPVHDDDRGRCRHRGQHRRS